MMWCAVRHMSGFSCCVCGACMCTAGQCAQLPHSLPVASNNLWWACSAAMLLGVNKTSRSMWLEYHGGGQSITNQQQSAPVGCCLEAATTVVSSQEFVLVPLVSLNTRSHSTHNPINMQVKSLYHYPDPAHNVRTGFEGGCCYVRTRQRQPWTNQPIVACTRAQTTYLKDQNCVSGIQTGPITTQICSFPAAAPRGNVCYSHVSSK